MAALLFALAAALAWGAGHAQEASCPGAAVVDARLRQQVIATRSGPLAYYRFGHGAPLLLITGYRATVSEWNATLLQKLAAQHDVIVLENPGVGRSRTDPVPQTMEGMADGVSHFIDALQLGRVDVVGWSMGGMVAQQLALDHPHQVHSLVLMSTTQPGSQAIPVSATAMATLSGRSASPFDAIMAVLFPPAARAQAVRCFRSEMFRPDDYGHVSVDARVADAQAHAMAAWWDDDHAAAELSRVRVPALVIAGAKDEVLSPDNSRALAKALPYATLDEVGDGGHALMYQDPAGTAATIARFLLNVPHGSNW